MFWKEEIFYRITWNYSDGCCRELKQAGIACETETGEHGNTEQGRGIFLGRVGEKVNLEIMYYVYVSREDVSEGQTCHF